VEKPIVVVTGAAGFIGRHVAREFSEKGWYVIGIGRGSWLDWREYGLSAWHCSDVNFNSLQEYASNPNVIIHCAGGASVGISIEQPADDFNLTVKTTSDVLEFIRLCSPSTRLIYPSSAAVYGHVKTLPITEVTSLNPISPYGVHKQIAEILCKLYAKQYGLSVAIVRLFSIYGNGLRKQLLWDACQKFERGENEFFGTGEEVRDWLHVEDVARLFIIAAKNATKLCPVVNAGSGHGVPVKELLQYVSNQLGFRLQPVFSSNPKVGDPNAFIADISKARYWNWMPTIDWREGILQYVKWYKQCQ